MHLDKKYIKLLCSCFVFPYINIKNDFIVKYLQFWYITENINYEKLLPAVYVIFSNEMLLCILLGNDNVTYKDPVNN